jgi:hypothetical protein
MRVARTVDGFGSYQLHQDLAKEATMDRVFGSSNIY